MRSEKPSFCFNAARRAPHVAPSPLHPLIRIFLGLLLVLSGCKGENNPSPPRLPAGVANISKTEALSIGPDTAASGNSVYVVWQEDVGGQNMEVFLARSGDGGATFGDPVNVSESTAFSGNPQIAVSGSFVYVVWEESASANTAEDNDIDIFYRRGEDQNGAFDWYPTLDQPPLRLSNPNHTCTDNSSGTPGDDPCPSQTPAIAASDLNIFVIWVESTIYQFKIITTNDPPAKEFQFINSEILMVHSADGGVGFDPTPLIVSGPKMSTLSPSINPTLAATAGKVYIAWEEIPQPLISKILFRRVIDPFNISFSPSLTDQATLLSGFIRGSSRPSLAAEGSRVYLAWEGFLPSNGACPAVQDNTPISASERSEIFFIRSDDEGANFNLPDPNNCAESNVSKTAGNSNGPKVAASGGFVYLSWMDSTPDLAGILFRKSEDNGNTFSAPARLVARGGSAANPSIVAVNGTLFTSWEDATLGNLEIVFTRR